MNGLVLLSIIASGYVYLKVHPLHRISTHTLQGRHLYLKSGTYGLVFFISSLFITYTFFRLVPKNSQLHDYLLMNLHKMGDYDNFHILIFISTILTFILVKVISELYRLSIMSEFKEEARERAEKYSNKPKNDNEASEDKAIKKHKLLKYVELYIMQEVLKDSL